MKFGAWIHDGDGISEASQIAEAAACGLKTVRYYHFEGAECVVPAIKEAGMTLLAGMDVYGPGLIEDWRSQVRLEELARYQELGVPIEAICVGNELREFGDEPSQKRFTARLSYGMANVLSTYRAWLDERGLDTPLTYAMEGIVFDETSGFLEWIRPLIDACDVVSINAYPMDVASWFSFGAFEESRRLLEDGRVRRLRFNAFELHLRRVLEQLVAADKPLILSETGFPSAVGYRIDGEKCVVPESDNARYEEAMHEFVGIIRRVSRDYAERLRAVYFYEWRDNLHHGAIWNEAAISPIHTTFGLCDWTGKAKVDIRKLVMERGA